MKLKRWIASLLVMAIAMTGIQINVKANKQLPVENLKVTDVSATKGYHPITGQAVIAPKVKLGWNDPGTWDPGAGAGQDAVQHPPKRYLIEVRNALTSVVDRIITIPYDPANKDKAIPLENYYNFAPGTLYEFKVVPEHSHLNSVSDDISIKPYYNPKVYALTDLNVKTETTEQSINVSWTHVKASGVSYKITYAQVDYTDSDDRSKFENSAKKYEILVSATDSKVTADAEKGLLSYTISGSTDGRIEPGKPYAVTVEPIIVIDGKTVAYNAKPIIYSCYTTVFFRVFDEGDYIRFEWNISDSFRLNDGDHPLTNTYIYEFIDGAVTGTPILNFPGTNGANINYYKIEKKDATDLKYQLVLQYDGYPDDVKSEKVLFIPNQIAITPTKPDIPEPLSTKIVKSLKKYMDGEVIYGELADRLSYFTKTVPAGLGLSRKDAVEKLVGEKYLLPGDITEADKINDLLTGNRTFHIKDTDKIMNLVWTPFQYTDYNTKSPTYNKKIADFNVLYDLTVTNDFNELASAPKIKNDLQFDASLDSAAIVKDKLNNTIGFSYDINKYFDKKQNKIVDLVPGQIYYIQLVAKKKYSSTIQSSQPRIVSVYYGYDGDIYPPPTMSNPPLKTKEVTKDSATLQWREEWFEVTSNSSSGSLKSWAHEIWAKENGLIHSDPSKEADLKHFVLESQTDVGNLRDYVGTTNFQNSYITRKIDLGKDPYGISDVKYKLLRLDYKDVEKELALVKETQPNYTLDDYVQDLIKSGEAGTTLNWKDITVKRDKIDPNQVLYTEEGLQPNELYLFLLKPYRQMANGDILMNYYPASIIVSTPDVSDPLEPTPTVPGLSVESGYSDVEMKVIWDYNNAFTYEVKYGDVEDINAAKSIKWKIEDDYEADKIPSFIDNYKVTVKDLFPDTTYFFWIRATSKANGKLSAWSNAAIGHTKDLDHPIPPRAVGMGSTATLKKHGVKKSIDKDYITVEWILDDSDSARNPKDTTPGTGDSKIQKAYSYIFEVADNPVFLDATVIEITDDNLGSTEKDIEILEKKLVQVKKLISNRVYYIRMKTVVTVINTENNDKIVKESLKYSPTVFLITKESNDEYDGNKDPSREVLPDKDYEIIYDKTDKSLTFRFRGEGEGDNNVDQRLLTRLMEKHLTSYEVDVKKYKNYEIDKWKILIPDTIMQGLQDNQVDLLINGGAIAMNLPSTTFKDARTISAYQYGKDPTYKVEIDKQSAAYQSYHKPSTADKPLSRTFDVKFNVSNDLMDYNIVYAEDEFTVKLRPNSRYQYVDANADPYIYNPETLEWKRAKGQLDQLDGLVTFDTGVVGEYALYANEDKVKNVQHWSEDARSQVLKELNITGYEKGYNPNNKVTTGEIMNLSLGLMLGNKDIPIKTSLKKDQLASLKYAGILPGTNLSDFTTRNQAMESLVKTYELKNGEAIFVPKSVKDPMAYKAYKVGLITSKELERSNEALSYGEMFYMLQGFLE